MATATKTGSEKDVYQSRGPNILLGLGSAIIFATSVTNTIVYAQGTTSSQGMSSGASGENGGVGINSNCALIMLIINIIIAIISFIAMIYFFYRAVYSKKERQLHAAQATNAYYAGTDYTVTSQQVQPF